MELTPTQQKDLETYDRVAAEARAIFVERMSTYGNSWREMKPESIADHIRMKMFRTSELGTANDKALDECLDTINYSNMLHIRLQELKND